MLVKLDVLNNLSKSKNRYIEEFVFVAGVDVGKQMLNSLRVNERSKWEMG